MFWILDHIMQHLDRLGMLKLDMLAVAKALGQVLVQQFSKQAPGGSVIHPEHMVSLRDKLL